MPSIGPPILVTAVPIDITAVRMKEVRWDGGNTNIRLGWNATKNSYSPETTGFSHMVSHERTRMHDAEVKAT